MSRFWLHIAIILLLSSQALLFFHSEVIHPEGCDNQHDLHDFCTLIASALKIESHKHPFFIFAALILMTIFYESMISTRDFVALFSTLPGASMPLFIFSIPGALRI